MRSFYSITLHVIGYNTNEMNFNTRKRTRDGTNITIKLHMIYSFTLMKLHLVQILSKRRGMVQIDPLISVSAIKMPCCHPSYEDFMKPIYSKTLVIKTTYTPWCQPHILTFFRDRRGGESSWSNNITNAMYSKFVLPTFL